MGSIEPIGRVQDRMISEINSLLDTALQTQGGKLFFGVILGLLIGIVVSLFCLIVRGK